MSYLSQNGELVYSWRMGWMCSCISHSESAAGKVGWRTSFSDSQWFDALGEQECPWWRAICPVSSCSSLWQKSPTDSWSPDQLYGSVCPNVQYPSCWCRLPSRRQQRTERWLPRTGRRSPVTCCTPWNSSVASDSGWRESGISPWASSVPELALSQNFGRPAAEGSLVGVHPLSQPPKTQLLL